MQHALSESLLVAMEEWAAKQPAALPDALEAVERISELLDLSGLFSALLLHPRRDRKSLSYTGGHPSQRALESYLTKDGCRVMTRDPGDDLWAQTFDWLAPEPSTPRAISWSPAASADALPARRAAADRRCRAHVGGAAAVGQPAPAESDAGDRWVPRQLQVLPKVRRRSLRAVALCHVGAYWPPSERMPAKKKNDIRNAPRLPCPRRVRNWKQACSIFSGPARVEFGTGNRRVPFFLGPARVEFGTGNRHVPFFPSCPRGVPRKVPRGGRPVRNCGQLYQAIYQATSLPKKI